MSTSNAAGERVAAAIGVIKWILITLAVLAAGVVVVQAARSTAGGALRSQFAGVAVLGAIVGAIVLILFVWVVFGWFQHTLEALITIAQNTAPDQRPTYQNPQPYNGPPPQYNQPPR